MVVAVVVVVVIVVVVVVVVVVIVVVVVVVAGGCCLVDADLLASEKPAVGGDSATEGKHDEVARYLHGWQPW